MGFEIKGFNLTIYQTECAKTSLHPPYVTFHKVCILLDFIQHMHTLGDSLDGGQVIIAIATVHGHEPVQCKLKPAASWMRCIWCTLESTSPS